MVHDHFISCDVNFSVIRIGQEGRSEWLEDKHSTEYIRMLAYVWGNNLYGYFVADIYEAVLYDLAQLSKERMSFACFFINILNIVADIDLVSKAFIFKRRNNAF